MRQPLRVTIGLWLERIGPLRPLLLRYSHEHPPGRKHYINRVSRTFASRGVR